VIIVLKKYWKKSKWTVAIQNPMKNSCVIALTLVKTPI